MTDDIAADFAQRVLNWFDHFGRKDLPWQQQKSAYSVWISEIMLQQTQVATVIPYFQRFIKQFPDLEHLATASIDEVLALWSGLGYYSRARHLHNAAQHIQQFHHGIIPDNLDKLMTLPGIGRSTAGAILSLAGQQQHSILDGNVKRVLSRYFLIVGDPGSAMLNKRLWQHAERLTPVHRCGDYNQAMMDLGATVCTRSKPKCSACPLHESCQASLNELTADYPQKKPKKSLPEKNTIFLLLTSGNQQILLEKRANLGVWEGLWSFPQVSAETQIDAWLRSRQLTPISSPKYWPVFRHTFSHFHLLIQPVHFQVQPGTGLISEPNQWLWHTLDECAALGVPSPVKKLLLEIARSLKKVENGSGAEHC